MDKVIHKDTFRREMQRMCHNLNLGEHKPHDTCHTFISLASNVGIDEIIIKRIVGHSSKDNIIQEVYTHKGSIINVGATHIRVVANILFLQ